MQQPARVLIVEDDDGIQDFISIVLREEGYVILSVSQGKVALEVVGQFAPDLILLDLRMPLMDGSSFVQAYYQSHPSPAPIVVVSALRNAAQIAQEINATDFLAKPFSLDELLDCVTRHISKNNHQM